MCSNRRLMGKYWVELFPNPFLFHLLDYLTLSVELTVGLQVVFIQDNAQGQ